MAASVFPFRLVPADSIVRPQRREKQFKWIDDAVTLDYQFFKLKSKQRINPRDFTDTKSYRIGTIKGGAIHNFLKKNDFRNVSQPQTRLLI